MLFLGDDEMTVEKILELNKQHAITNGYFDKKIT